jgi:SAM-dependent methyltransferase
MEHKNIFNRIYNTGLWRANITDVLDPNIEPNSQIYRPFVENFIKNQRIISVMEIGCGNWETLKGIDLSGVDYTGVDVSDVVLSLAKQNAPPGTKLLNVNAVYDPLPTAELLLMKDVLQHWSNDDVLRFLPKMHGYDYALITNGFVLGNESLNVNIDQETGGFRPIDLTKEPFSLVGDYIFSFDATPREVKKIFLWERGCRS